MGPPFKGEYFGGTFSKTSNNPKSKENSPDNFSWISQIHSPQKKSCFFSLAANNPDPYEQIADPYLGTKKKHGSFRKVAKE